MRKIPTLFQRDPETHLVTDQVTTGCEWVLRGEGVPTEMFDGVPCMVKSDSGFDPVLLTRVDGIWRWVDQDSPNRKPCVEAWARQKDTMIDGTYVLVGPEIHGNPYGLEHHELWRHGSVVLDLRPPRSLHQTYMQLLYTCPYIEGVVWHLRDGRMAKIRRQDFGLVWPVRRSSSTTW